MALAEAAFAPIESIRTLAALLEIGRVIRLFEANGEVDRSRRSLERERMARDRKPDTFVETF